MTYDPHHITDTFTAAPQIAPEDVALIAQKGFVSIICNRPDGESADQPSAQNIAAVAEKMGLAFHYLPISGLPPEQAVVTQMAAAIAAANGGVLAYCRSGTRSTNLWALVQAGHSDMGLDKIIGAAAGGGYDVSGLRPLMDQYRAQR